MRAFVRGAGVFGALVLLAVAGSAAAQSSVEGPLASPDTVAPGKRKPVKGRGTHRKTAKARTAVPASAEAIDGGSTASQPILNRPANAPGDPLSFGMKWNGSSDNARETRVQNYDGSGSGTGAEVGMKLHF